MKTGEPVARLSARLRKAFPERQIYVRSAGRVQFFIFGPYLQGLSAAVFLIFLGFFSEGPKRPVVRLTEI